MPAVDTGGGGSVLGSAEALARSNMLANVEAARDVWIHNWCLYGERGAERRRPRRSTTGYRMNLMTRLIARSVRTARWGLKAISHLAVLTLLRLTRGPSSFCSRWYSAAAAWSLVGALVAHDLW